MDRFTQWAPLSDLMFSMRDIGSLVGAGGLLISSCFWSEAAGVTVQEPMVSVRGTHWKQNSHVGLIKPWLPCEGWCELFESACNVAVLKPLDDLLVTRQAALSSSCIRTSYSESIQASLFLVHLVEKNVNAQISLLVLTSKISHPQACKQERRKSCLRYAEPRKRQLCGHDGVCAVVRMRACYWMHKALFVAVVNYDNLPPLRECTAMMLSASAPTTVRAGKTSVLPRRKHLCDWWWRWQWWRC